MRIVLALAYRSGQSMTTPTHIKDLVPDPANRRRHNPRNIGMVAEALHAVGAARSIVIDEGNVILAGNGVTEAAAEAGITKVRVIDADGDELIAVRRSGLSPEQKRALALWDNRTAELATWDVEQLAADLDAGLSLADWFAPDETAGLLAQLTHRSTRVRTRCPPLGPRRLKRATSSNSADIGWCVGTHVSKPQSMP